MSVLFSSFDIKRMRLRNRFVRSATFEAASEPDGEVSPLELEMYRNLAVGEVGLIISGICCVHENGRLFPSQNCLARDEAIPGMAQLAQTVHDHGGKVAVQLMHAGREASRFMPAEGLAPSVVRDDPHFDLDHRVMTDEEILKLVNAFGAAAGRAREAGFDAVQVHGAHAYLLAQFLSPLQQPPPGPLGWRSEKPPTLALRGPGKHTQKGGAGIPGAHQAGPSGRLRWWTLFGRRYRGSPIIGRGRI